jgi:hypothetical protein
LNDVKNSIFKKLGEIRRTGGPKNYQDSIDGKKGGVDREGHKMNTFIGTELLENLLVTAKVGVYVDKKPLPPNASVAAAANSKPYIYVYRAEDILSWSFDIESDDPCDFKSLLLQDVRYQNDEVTDLPSAYVRRLRHIFKNKAGLIQVDLYDPPIEGGAEGGPDVPKYAPTQTYTLDAKIKRIPFVLFELSDSLLADVANYQIAMLNVASSDIAYLTKANFPFYVEMYDPKAEMPWLKGEQNANGQTPDKGKTKEMRVGPSSGRRIPKGMDFMPQFIHPSSEPIKASMEKQEKMVEEIRMLINLSLSNVKAKSASAESKQMDSQGLESGLAYIGLELEHGEQRIAEFWAMYEGSEPATIKYPEKWCVESEESKTARIKQIKELINAVPSLSYKKELAKEMAYLLFATKISKEALEKINKEIDSAKVFVTDIMHLKAAWDAGFVDADTGSIAAGFPEGVAAKAQKEQVERLKIVAETQSKAKGGNAATSQARGAPAATSVDPDESSKEKDGKKKRGEGVK